MYERIWGEQKAEAPSKVSGGTSVISSSRKEFQGPRRLHSISFRYAGGFSNGDIDDYNYIRIVFLFFFLVICDQIGLLRKSAHRLMSTIF